MVSNLAEDTTDATLSPRARRRISAQDTRDRRRTLLVGALVTALGFLLVNAVVGENGYLATLAARREHAALVEKVTRLRVANQDLQQQSRRLVDDPTALEEAARRQLGLIKPGETLLVIRDTTPASPAPRPAP